MTAREGCRVFLEQAGWGQGEVRPLAGDASFRRYFRIFDRGRTAVLMDAPPEREDLAPFLFVADFLLAHGFSAPRLLAADTAQGFLLLEDFGDRVVGPVLAKEPALEDEVYRSAVQLLVALHRVPPPATLPSYDRAALLREAMLFPDWYGRAAAPGMDVDGFVRAFDAIWTEALAETTAHPVVTLRDYHAENLLLLDRPGVQGLGLLDFQDALAGHPAYDLVSLLQDARRDVSPRLEERMIDAYGAAAGVTDRQRFRAAYEVLGAQRNVKILGIFVRLRDRDHRSGYVERLPRVWSYLKRNLRHPALRPLREWFDRNVPAAARGPWCR